MGKSGRRFVNTGTTRLMLRSIEPSTGDRRHMCSYEIHGPQYGQGWSENVFRVENVTEFLAQSATNKRPLNYLRTPLEPKRAH